MVDVLRFVVLRDRRREGAEVAKCAKQGMGKKTKPGKGKLEVSRGLLSESIRDLRLTVAT